jgi:hypothetical protein
MENTLIFFLKYDFLWKPNYPNPTFLELKEENGKESLKYCSIYVMVVFFECVLIIQRVSL